MDTTEMNRLRWCCRRGLLENDLVLERFLGAHAATLEGERLAAFTTLLDYGDDELWNQVIARQLEMRRVASNGEPKQFNQARLRHPRHRVAAE